MSRCECGSFYASYRSVEGEKVFFQENKRHHMTCDQCDAWLSLGPANDTPEAMVELRAAELAARSTTDAVREWYRLDYTGAIFIERQGWMDHAAGDGGPQPSPYPMDRTAGWLARAIATHDTHADAESA